MKIDNFSKNDIKHILI